MKREYNDMTGSKGKAAAPWLNDDAAGNDELLAVLGYKVRSNDMAEVASKIEQLEMAMGTFQDDGASQFSESVHYNPSDLSGWIHSLLSELNPVPERRFEDNSEYDLRAIPGIAAYRPPSPPPPPPQQMSPDSTLTTASNKRMKSEPLTPTGSSSSSTSTVSPEKSSGAVVVDSQEAGVRLVHTLMACAESIQGENLTLADALVKQVGRLAVSQSGAMRKVATYYAEALARRIYGIRPHLSAADAAYTNLLQTHFYECTPYLKFAHFTANQALLEAFNGAKRVHVIDFSMNQGVQWPALLQALALRPGGPPSFRLTGVGPPQEDGTDALQEVGWKLARFAETVGVEFHYRGFVCQSLTDLEPGLLDIHEPGPDPEILAVNSVFELHPLLARPGAFDKVLQNIKSMKPKIITVVEQESNHNGAVFVDRFNESLHYYSTMFDSMESGDGGEAAAHDVLMSEVYLGRQICNVVACEGVERSERHETLSQWRVRMESGGLEPVHLGSNAFKQASMLLALFAGGDGYTVVENEGCLLLGWHNRSLIATSAWRLP